MPPLTLTGHCLCHMLTYKITVPDKSHLKLVLCHCAPCRILSGSTYGLDLLVPTPSFNAQSTIPPSTYTRTGDSGHPLTNTFCGKCGVTVYVRAEAENLRGVVIVKAGTLSEEGGGLEGLGKPVKEIYCAGKVAWVGVVVE